MRYPPINKEEGREEQAAGKSHGKLVYESKENTPPLWARIMEYVLHAVRPSKKVPMVVLLTLMMGCLGVFINCGQMAVCSKAFPNFKSSGREIVMTSATCVTEPAWARGVHQMDLKLNIQQTMIRLGHYIPEDYVEKDNRNVGEAVRPCSLSEEHIDAVVFIDQGNTSIVAANKQDLKWRFDSRTVVSLEAFCIRDSPSKFQLRSRLACQGAELKAITVVGDGSFRAYVLSDFFMASM